MSTRIPRSRSALASFMATALVAATAATLTMASPAGAAENRIDFGGGATGTTVGAGAVVRIDGRLVFETECPEEGYPDFVYPATDVYVVDAGSVSEGGRLQDASGWPNTIVATTTIFIEEIIAITSPGTASSSDQRTERPA